MHTLADKAPAAVADDWKTLDDAFTTIENALKDQPEAQRPRRPPERPIPQGIDASNSRP